MHWLLLVSGLLAAVLAICQLTMGKRMYLKPSMASNVDEVSKRVIQCVYHYESVVFVLSAITLLAAGFGYKFPSDPELLFRAISVAFALFGLVQLTVIFTTKVSNWISKLPHWIWFFLIAIFAWLGA